MDDLIKEPIKVGLNLGMEAGTSAFVRLIKGDGHEFDTDLGYVVSSKPAWLQNENFFFSFKDLFFPSSDITQQNSHLRPFPVPHNTGIVCRHWG